MRVFISWSGERSKAIAEVLRGWLPSVLQAVKPYFSPDDIQKGTLWGTQLAWALKDCQVGLLVVTPENTSSDWLVFEAGAIAKAFTSSKVCPLLFDGLAPTDLDGPLAMFQSAAFSKSEMRRVVGMLNAELGHNALQPHALDDAFEQWWPRLDNSIEGVLSTATTSPEVLRRTDRALLEEVLTITRRISREVGAERGVTWGFKDEPLVELFARLLELLTHIYERGPDDETACRARAMFRPMGYMLGMIAVARNEVPALQELNDAWEEVLQLDYEHEHP